MGASKRISPRGDGMTPLEQWRLMAMAENKRAQRNWRGLENDQPVTIPKADVEAAQSKNGKGAENAARICARRLHMEGVAPSEIAARMGSAEAVVWKDLRRLYHEGQNRMSLAYLQMRLARVQELKAQGLELPEIADLLGVTTTLLLKDIREIPQDQARAAPKSQNTGRTPHG